MAKLDDFMTAREASCELGIKYKTFLQRINRKKITHIRLANRVILIPRAVMDNLFEDEEEKAKRPPQDHPLSDTYKNMIRRCYSPGATGYERYGGRGIKVCDRWLEDFRCFVEDMGERPSNLHTVDREDNDGDYTPDNCRWATRKEQAQNRG